MENTNRSLFFKIKLLKQSLVFFFSPPYFRCYNYYWKIIHTVKFRTQVLFTLTDLCIYTKTEIKQLIHLYYKHITTDSKYFCVLAYIVCLLIIFFHHFSVLDLLQINICMKHQVTWHHKYLIPSKFFFSLDDTFPHCIKEFSCFILQNFKPSPGWRGSVD